MPSRKRVMVIDDDQDFISFVHIVLETGGYEVDTALTVTDGLAQMRRTPPDLVIADVMVAHELDGGYIGLELKADNRLAHIPLLMVSAIISVKDDDLFTETVARQADAFLSKPITPALLLERVAELISP